MSPASVSPIVHDPALARLGVRLAEIALEAAAVIRPFWRANVTVERKADSSPVTEADRRAEALIVERLERDFPGVQVIGEEGCAERGTPSAAAPRFFLVDALDGTRGFVRGSEEFTVNIALIERGAPVAGAVATPADDRVWHTTAIGAALRTRHAAERPIRARVPAGALEALVSTTLGPKEAERLRRLHGFERWRAVNSSLKLCLIAEGQADLYPRDRPTNEWDIAAGQAVLEAAGGRVETLDGARLSYGKAEATFLNPAFTAWGASPGRDPPPAFPRTGL